MARPKIDQKYKALQVCFQLRPEAAARLDACRQPWQSRAAQIREIIEAYLIKVKGE